VTLIVFGKPCQLSSRTSFTCQSYNLIEEYNMASKRKVNLDDYQMTTTLGTGSFGRVLLSKNKKSGDFFAMKRLKKADIIKLR